MKRALSVVGLSLVLGLAACGDDDESGSGGGGPTPAPSGDTVNIGMDNTLKYKPVRQQVRVGQNVIWTNEESVPHNVIANEGADFESSTFGEGETYEYRAEQAGLIKYECTLHPGMVGELDVR